MQLRGAVKQLCENAKRDGSKFYEKAKQHPLICLILTFAILLLITLPNWRVSQYEINNATTNAKLENQYRTTLAQILGDAAIDLGLYYT